MKIRWNGGNTRLNSSMELFSRVVSKSRGYFNPQYNYCIFRQLPPPTHSNDWGESRVPAFWRLWLDWGGTVWTIEGSAESDILREGSAENDICALARAILVDSGLVWPWAQLAYCTRVRVMGSLDVLSISFHNNS